MSPGLCPLSLQLVYLFMLEIKFCDFDETNLSIQNHHPNMYEHILINLLTVYEFNDTGAVI